MTEPDIIGDARMEIRERNVRIRVKLSNDPEKRNDEARDAISVLMESAALVAAAHGLERPSDAQAMQERIGGWARHTFPDQTNMRLANHLAEEAEGLREVCRQEVGYAPSRMAEEIADVIILALCLADRNGIRALDAVAEKMAENVKATYAYDPELGYDKRVRGGSQ